MGTVVYNVLKYWKSTNEYDITIYVPENFNDEYKRILNANGIKVKVLGKTNYFKWEQVILPNAVKKGHADVLWCPYNTAPIYKPCKMIVTINDVIYMSSTLKSAPSLYKKLGIVYRKNIVPFAARNAEKIIAISEFDKKEIAEYFPKVKNKTDVIYLSADSSAEKLRESDKQKFFNESGIKKAYILGFGSLEKRKNSLRLIQAYEKLPNNLKEQYQLVLFGFRGYEDSEDYKYIKEHRLNDIVVLDYVSDEEKMTLYAESKMFVFPTLAEGFGIPVLEAFANHTPVITSNITSLPEVAGEAAVLINPENTSEIQSAIESILGNEAKAISMISAGDVQLQKFSWEITAEKILERLVHVGKA